MGVGLKIGADSFPDDKSFAGTLPGSFCSSYAGVTATFCGMTFGPALRRFRTFTPAIARSAATTAAAAATLQ